MKKAVKIYLFTNPLTCQPCRTLDKAIEGVEFDLTVTQIVTGAQSTPEEQKLKAKFEIRSIPTLVFVDEDENLVHKMRGGYPNAVSVIKTTIKQLI